MPRQSQLQRELRQSQPFRSLAQEAVLAILRTADVLRRRYAEQVEPYGITPQQYNVLRILRGAAGEPMPTLEIADRLIERTPGITRLLDRLEAKGLVRRSRCAEDRRLVHCRITEEGEALLDRVESLVAETDAWVTRGLRDEEVERLLDLLERIRHDT